MYEKDFVKGGTKGQTKDGLDGSLRPGIERWERPHNGPWRAT